MNLVLLEEADFIAADRVRLTGRRLAHVRDVFRAKPGAELRVGVIGGRIGQGRIVVIDNEQLEMEIALNRDPPDALPLRLILALPRPKVLNRTIAAAASMGIRDIHLINAWRVEKSYWNSPRLCDESLRMQSVLGLEQAGDTVLPTIRLHRLFTPFVREDLPNLIAGRLPLLADPGAEREFPRQVSEPVVLAIGPEGGFIEGELHALREAGFTPVSLGPRVLRVETAIACAVGRLLA